MLNVLVIASTIFQVKLIIAYPDQCFLVGFDDLEKVLISPPQVSLQPFIQMGNLELLPTFILNAAIVFHKHIQAKSSTSDFVVHLSLRDLLCAMNKLVYS